MADDAARGRPLPRGAVAGLFAALAGVLAVLPIAARVEGVPLSMFVRDTFSIAEIPVYAGIVSNLGVFLWSASAAVCGFTALLVANDPATRRFLGASAGFGGLFAVDDFFMLHEWLVPRFLGFPEESVYAVYAGLLALYAIAYRGPIRSLAPGLFVLAVALLSSSVGVDLVQEEEASPWGFYLEEGLKLLGIGSWLAYASTASAGVLGGPRSATTGSAL